MSPSRFWKRAIVLLDMNAFFAGIEQRDDPSLRGRPVAITNGTTGTCIITCSYEARAHGVHTGMRLREALERCPDLIQRPARPERYAEVSRAIMQALHNVCPDVEIFSVDEAFVDVTRCQKLHGPPERIARLLKAAAVAASGVPCSVGLSGDKTTAKYAAKLHKPDGFTVIPPWEARAALREVPVTELCGINRGIGDFLAARGVITCGDMARLPIGELARRFGNPGRRVWLMCQGLDSEPVRTDVPPPKSIGHGKVMPPDTRDPQVIRVFLLHMSEKVGARLRRHAMLAQVFLVALATRDGWLADHYRSEAPTDDGRRIYRFARRLLTKHWRGEGVFQVQIRALDPRPADGQLGLFDAPAHGPGNAVMDAINARYGEFTLAPATLLRRSDMPNVIAPSWKPFGHRETILHGFLLGRRKEHGGHGDTESTEGNV